MDHESSSSTGLQKGSPTPPKGMTTEEVRIVPTHGKKNLEPRSEGLVGDELAAGERESWIIITSMY